MEYRIRQHSLQQGALEIQYIEALFGEFQRRKTASEVVARLNDRDHQIVMAEAPLPDPATIIPVEYKVSQACRSRPASEDVRRISRSESSLQVDWWRASRLAWSGVLSSPDRRVRDLGARQWI